MEIHNCMKIYTTYEHLFFILLTPFRIWIQNILRRHTNIKYIQDKDTKELLEFTTESRDINFKGTGYNIAYNSELCALL